MVSVYEEVMAKNKDTNHYECDQPVSGNFINCGALLAIALQKSAFKSIAVHLPIPNCRPVDLYVSPVANRHNAKATLDFQKSPSSDFIWRGTKDFSYLIGANFTDPKTGRCAWTNQSSSQGPLGMKLSLTSTKRSC